MERVHEDYSYIEISDDEDDGTPLCDIAPSTAIREFIDLVEDDQSASVPPSGRPRLEAQREDRPMRNSEPLLPEIYVDTCELTGQAVRDLGPTARTVKIGHTVEISAPPPQGPLQTGDFLRVFKIIQNVQTGEITLRGLSFRRNKFLRPMLPTKLNEVCLVVSIDEEDHRPYYIQGMEEIPLSCAMRKRRLQVTDLTFPKLSYREHLYFNSSGPDAKCMQKNILENEVLVCRNVFAYIYGKGERRLKRRTPYQGLLRFILPSESDNRGGVLTTGKRTEHVDLSDDVDDDPTAPVNQEPLHGPYKERQYTYGDCFQGAGGASHAAQLASLRLVWGFDHDLNAVATASTNFRRARVFQCEAGDFPPPGFNPHVDILHLSPPCQTFSPACTNPNLKKDELNTDALLSVGAIIRAVKPRIVTLEETFGLLTREKNQQWFGILLSMIHSEGYSMRWAIHNTLEYGISQPRKRLTLVAAAPGIPLPNLPPPTHGPAGTGLLPFVSVSAAVGRVPRGTSHHDPQLAKRINKPPYDPNKPFEKTLLCNNSEAYHWSGRRKFTNRELARIQGFPLSYKFEGCATEVQRQIGNAVPPPYFKLVFEQCIKTLRKFDRQQRVSGEVDNDNDDDDDVMVLDESTCIDDHTDIFERMRRSVAAPPQFGSGSPLPPSSQRLAASPGTSSTDAIVIEDGEEQDVIVLD